MINYNFTKFAEKEFVKLPKDIQQHIIKKIEFYLSATNPLTFAKRIFGSSKSTFRFHINGYRVIFDWEGSSILITRVGPRKDIYRR
ncbi:MAG: type II toxin-antitoxin system RelE/ParE family toxin [Elusimicrobiota bacterium]